MNEEFAHINQMRAVTISREYGSGGGEIATRLAKRLRWQLIDHAVVERVASEVGTSLEEAEVYDEHVQGIISQVLGSLLYLYPGYMAGDPGRPAGCLARPRHRYV
jgi:cytidylate kinase